MFRSGRVDGPSYRELTPAHPLYGMAAFAYHHAARMPEDERRGLLAALEHAWPRTQGDHKEREYRELLALEMRDAGHSIDEIADTFCVAPDTARRWVRRAEQSIYEPDPGPRVEITWDEDGDEPIDPASWEARGRLLVQPPAQEARQAEDHRRVRAARRAVDDRSGDFATRHTERGRR